MVRLDRATIRRAGLTIAALLSSSFPSNSYAFTYAEHFAISLSSFYRACDAELADQAANDKGDGNSKLTLICKNPYVAICQAHLSATVADFVEESIDYNKAGVPKKVRSLYFQRRSAALGEKIPLVCTDVGATIDNSDHLGTVPCKVLNALSNVVDGFYAPRTHQNSGCDDVGDQSTIWYADWYDRRLFENRFLAAIDYIKLALRNWGHFQPDSRDRAQRAEERSFNGATLREQFMAHAFAMHYLEDSFAAGHNGLPRRRDPKNSNQLGLRQDYAHAYHDDMNKAGEFLMTRDLDPWFSFGDGKLFVPAYFTSSPFALRLAPKDYLVELIAVLKRGNENSQYLDGIPTDKKLIEGIEKVQKLESASTSILATLSLPKRQRGFVNSMLCAGFESCDKLVVVLHLPSEAERATSHCVKLSPSETIEVWRCWSTVFHVLVGAENAQRTFLHRFRNVEIAEASRGPSVLDNIPSGYHSIATSNTAMMGQLNSQPLVVVYEAESSKTTVKNTGAFGFNVDVRNGAKSYLRSRTVNFSYQESTSRLPNLIDFAEVDIGFLENAHSRWRLAEGFGGRLGRVRRPSEGEISSLALVLDFGIDRILDGPVNRNAYVGLGGEIEIEAGRYLVFMRGTAEEHWNSRVGWSPAYMLSVGLRVPALTLE